MADPELDFAPSFLPPFANDANKKLDREVKELEGQLERTKAGTDANQDRIAVMLEHLTNVQQELLFTQTRVDGKAREIETEDHLKRMTDREAGRLVVELKSLDKLILDAADKMAALQAGIYKGSEKMDQFKLLMSWNQEELEQWALASRQKEEDNLALEKYRRADDARVKDLNLQIEKLAMHITAKRAELETEVTETQAAQVQLDKTADDFRSLHAERQQLVAQWEEAVAAIKRRDAAIQAASERFADRRRALRERQAALDERARFYEQEQANNKELGLRIATAERAVAKARSEYAGEAAAVTAFNDEVDVTRGELSKAAEDLAGAQARAAALRNEVESKARRLEALQAKLAAAQDKLGAELDALASLEERTAALERMRSAEVEQLKLVVREVSDLKERQFRDNQALFALRSAEKDLIAEIAGGQSQNKNLAAKIASLDAIVIKQQGDLYGAEFQIQAMERKVARASGVRSDEETRKLNALIAGLTQQLDAKAGEHAMLVGAVKRAEEDLKAGQRKVDAGGAEASKLQAGIDGLQLECETAGRSVKGAIKAKEDALVSSDLLKLEVRKLRDGLNGRADDVFSLENRKLQLQLSLEERRAQIGVHHDVLRAQLKAASDDAHRVTLELKERQMRASQLGSKYDVVQARTKGPGGSGDDAGGEPKSAAYYVIKAAQDRELLQREGDGLDASIRQAEKEVKALEATLDKLVGTNHAYRGSFRPTSDRGLVADQAALREKLDRAYDRMKFKRAEERQLGADLTAAATKLESARRESAAAGAVLDELRRRAGGAQAELADQSAKQQRAAQRVASLQRAARVPAGGAEVYAEAEFRLAELREGNKLAMEELRTAAMTAPEVGERAEAAGVRLGGPRLVEETRGSKMSASLTPAQVIDFLGVGFKLKRTLRAGWVKRGVQRPESVADHSWRMAILALVGTPPGLDRDKCIRIALVHDLSEAIVGDITPEDNVPKAEKHRLESAAMVSFETLLGAAAGADAPRAAELRALWDEYESGASPEALFLKDLDKIEMLAQALEYETEQPRVDLDEFYTSLTKLTTPLAVSWGEEIARRRRKEPPPDSA